MPKTKGGSLLLIATLAFINTIKDKYNLKYIQLKDNSAFYCKNVLRSSIANLYMFKYGFMPFNTDTYSFDVAKLVDYKINQKIIKIIKVKHTNIKNYLLVTMNKFNL